MNFSKITNYDEYVAALLQAGFTMGGSNDEKVFSMCSHFAENIEWHTETPETDPWEWRMKVLDERNDIAYAKLFFNKSGYITREWYPYFLAVRRGGKTLQEEYEGGAVSSFSKKIYELVRENDSLPMHIIKQMGSFSKEDKSKFDRGITELQMKMYITMCGRARKTSQLGEEYGWSSTVFCTTENFFAGEVFEKAAKITEQEGIEKITEQIYQLNPSADEKRIKKFIKG